jgi:hypothetical protein
MELKAGTRLKSTVCTTEVIVVRAPAGDVDVRCGGEPMVVNDASAGGVTGSVNPTHADGTLLGKRYGDEELGIEILCTKPGEGSLSIGDVAVPVKGAKPLPSSD